MGTCGTLFDPHSARDPAAGPQFAREDFEGAFEWMPHSTRPTLSIETQALTAASIGNAVVAALPETGSFLCLGRRIMTEAALEGAVRTRRGQGGPEGLPRREVLGMEG